MRLLFPSSAMYFYIWGQAAGQSWSKSNNGWFRPLGTTALPFEEESLFQSFDSWGPAKWKFSPDSLYRLFSLPRKPISPFSLWKSPSLWEIFLDSLELPILSSKQALCLTRISNVGFSSHHILKHFFMAPVSFPRTECLLLFYYPLAQWLTKADVQLNGFLNLFTCHLSSPHF